MSNITKRVNVANIKACFFGLFRFPLIRKIFKFLGWRTKYCLSCSKEGREEDLDEFIHCASSDCKGIEYFECHFFYIFFFKSINIPHYICKSADFFTWKHLFWGTNSIDTQAEAVGIPTNNQNRKQS